MKYLLITFLFLLPNTANACAVKHKPATAEMMKNFQSNIYGFKAEILLVKPAEKPTGIQSLSDAIKDSNVLSVNAKVIENYGMPLPENITFGLGPCNIVPHEGETSYFVATSDKETGNLVISGSPEWTIQEAIRTNPENWKKLRPATENTSK